MTAKFHILFLTPSARARNALHLFKNTPGEREGWNPSHLVTTKSAQHLPLRRPSGYAAFMTDAPKPERIAKVLARHGVASRREAEKIIEAGRVTVNGKTIDGPALNVTSADAITVDGKPLAEREPPRIWLYHKPPGLVTTTKDEKGRDTVFDKLPDTLPRVMTIGRLDLNSEGLLLLTNDGDIKRRLELPATGWLRKYRVRIHGTPDDSAFAPLRKGLTLPDGERFGEMDVSLDSQKGRNSWLTVSLREGRNREIRRAMEAIGLAVNRLIRVSYGPFRLGELKSGDVEEVRQKVVRDQLGLSDETGGKKPPTPQKPKRRLPRRSTKNPQNHVNKR